MRLDRSLFDRRDVLSGLLGAGALGWGAVAGETVLGYLTGLEAPEPARITVSGRPLEILAERKFVLVAYGPRPVIIFQLPDGRLRALSAVCTHGACNVQYRPQANEIYCACHHGRFTAEGVNVPGTPPPRPLRSFDLQQQADGTLVISAAPLDATSAPGRPGTPAGPTAG